MCDLNIIFFLVFCCWCWCWSWRIFFLDSKTIFVYTEQQFDCVRTTTLIVIECSVFIRPKSKSVDDSCVKLQNTLKINPYMWMWSWCCVGGPGGLRIITRKLCHSKARRPKKQTATATMCLHENSSTVFFFKQLYSWPQISNQIKF